MKLLIKTNSDNWDDSAIVAQGLMRDGYAINSEYTTIRAGQLPEQYLGIWHGVVERFRTEGLDDGGRVCVMAEAKLKSDVEIDDGDVTEIVSAALITHWQWGDGRITQEITMLDDASVVTLVGYLLKPLSYEL